jgi:hypothetical protein
MKEEPVYVMVTDWNDHWDNIEENTYYTKKLIKFDLQSHQLVENAPTLFIKVKEETYEMEGAWFGYVTNFDDTDVDNKGRKIISFDVQIEIVLNLNEALEVIKDIDAIPEPKLNPTPGWYLVSQTKFQKPQIKSSIIPEEFAFYPPFFNNLIKTKDHFEFEDLVFRLFKLIGINNICKIDKRGQAGKEDGFFVFGDLAVIYDCTLKTNFRIDKEEQINNYCRRLDDEEKLSCKSKGRSFNIKNKRKQVWIITRNKTQKIKDYPCQNGKCILVKEISIYDLIEIYTKRIKENFFEDKLERILENLGNY